LPDHQIRRTNTQPWHVYVCNGAVKQAITDDVLALMRSGGAGKYEDYDFYPADWKPEHRYRRRGVGWSLYSRLGIEKGDRVAAARQGACNFSFFDAQIGLFVTTDSYLGKGSWSGAGMYVPTIMLAAKGFSLDTCPQAAWIPVQAPIYRHHGIPADQALVCGMSLGYAGPAKVENTLVSEREALANVAHFRRAWRAISPNDVVVDAGLASHGQLCGYSSMKPPSISDYRVAARRSLPRFLFDYVDGGSYGEVTLRRNVADLEAVALRQRVLRDVSAIDLSTTLFGVHGGDKPGHWIVGGVPMRAV
jgi:nitroreductase